MRNRRTQACREYSGFRMLRSEKGIALVMVLVLSLISLAMVATLIFLVTQGTRFSGFNKRYETAREAGYGGSEVITAMIKNQGQLNSILRDALKIDSKSVTSPSNFDNPCDCGDTTNPDNITITTVTPHSCLCLKLCAPTLKTDGNYNWGTCDSDIDPTSSGYTKYDLSFELAGYGTEYKAYGKIVDTSLGNTDFSGLNLGGTAVVAASGTISPPPSPYLYTIEVTAQDKKYSTNQNLKERGRLSVLYAY